MEFRLKKKTSQKLFILIFFCLIGLIKKYDKISEIIRNTLLNLMIYVDFKLDYLV